MNPISSGFVADQFNLIYGSPGNQAGNADAKKIGPWSDSVYFKDGIEFSRTIADASSVASTRKPEVTNVVKDFIESVDAKEDVAAEMRASILSGESNNLHQTMIASEEASVSFTLMIEMRNKVMETYQELMRLQL